MQENKLLVDDNDESLVTWKNTSPRASIDLKKFKEEHQDLYLEYAKELKSTRVFLIK